MPKGRSSGIVACPLQKSHSDRTLNSAENSLFHMELDWRHWQRAAELSGRPVFREAVELGTATVTCSVPDEKIFVLNHWRAATGCIQGVVGGGTCAKLRENVPYVKVHRHNPNTFIRSWTVTEIMALQNPHIRTPTNNKIHTYTQPQITKSTHTHNHTFQNPHIHTTKFYKIHTYIHPHITKSTHTHRHTPTHYKTR